MSIFSRDLVDPLLAPNKKVNKIRTPKNRERSADELVKEIEERMSEFWLPAIYSQHILKLRTRSYDFPSLPRNSVPEIQHTLLGIELKVGSKRMLCPDLATARYLAAFARAGCKAIAIPYDITKISRLADEIESSWHRMMLMADSLTNKRSVRFATRVRTMLVGKVREAIAAAGAGTRIPEFKQTTRQVRR